MRVALALLVTTVAVSSALAAGDQQETRGIFSRMHRDPVESKALAAVGYSRRLRAMEIEFRHGGTYRYMDVPIDVYRQLIQSGSKAGFYNRNVRGRYASVYVRSRTSK